MNAEFIINPPAIVRQQFDVYYWHDVALKASQLRSMSNLKHAEALYYISNEKGYRDLGFDSMAEYVDKFFSRSKQWAEKLIQIHEKFAIHLEIPAETMEEVTFGKLSIIASHATQENKEEIIEKAINSTQRELTDYIKSLKSDSDSPESEEPPVNRSLTFKGPADMIEVVESALDSAKEQVAKVSKFYNFEREVPDLAALEYICSVFLTSASIEGEPLETLERSVQLLEHVYDVKIQWEKEVSSD